MSTTARAIGYVRVSTDEQVAEGFSLDAQRDRVTAYCTAKGFELLTVYADEGISGGTLNRTGLQQAINACQCGDAEHLVVLRLDRLTRRLPDLLTLLDHQLKCVEFHSITESLDSSTAAGKLVRNVLASFNEYERDRIAERTRETLAYKRKRHLPFNHDPLGFVADEKHQPMEKHADELATVRHILNLWRRGTSYRQIASKLNAEGVPTKRGRRWHDTTVRKIVLRREWYAEALQTV